MGDGREDASQVKCGACGGIAYEPYEEPGKTVCVRCGKYLQPGELVASTRPKELGSGSKVQGPKKEEESMSRKGEGREPVREIPKIITSFWMSRARLAELQVLLKTRAKMSDADLLGKDIKDLRKMGQIPCKSPSGDPHANPAPWKAGNAAGKYTRRPKAPENNKIYRRLTMPPQIPPPSDRQNRTVNDGAGLHVHCMACGFRMEISAEGIRALQKEIMDFAQVGIVVFGCSAIWILGRREPWRRWGYILGLASQPFWFYEAIGRRRWGILIISLIYTVSWAQGIYNFWIKERRVG